MITVIVYINERPILIRNARNQDGEENDKGQTKYRCDDGSVIWHYRKDGAAKLAKKMLDTIKEV